MSKNTLLSNLINYISANSSGNVVIAAPSSGYALDVTGTGRFTSSITGVNATFAGTPSNTVQAAGSPFLYLNGGTGTSYTTLQQGVGKFDIYQFNGSAFVNTFTITSAGNVGIGTTGSPWYLFTALDIGTNAALANYTDYAVLASNIYYASSSNWTFKTAGYGSALYMRKDDGNIYFSTFGTGSAGATATGVERMRITNAGEVQIGNNGSGSLKITDTAKSTTAASFLLSSSDSSLPMQLYFQRNQSVSYHIQSVEQGVSYRALYLNPNGGAVYAGGVRLDTLSDLRAKDNIQPISGALNTVMSLTGKKFHLKDEEEGKIRYGFIAQELEGVLDEFVIQTNNTFKVGDLEIENVKGIENWASSWSALLVEAIKELKAELDLLKQQ